MGLPVFPGFRTLIFRAEAEALPLRSHILAVLILSIIIKALLKRLHPARILVKPSLKERSTQLQIAAVHAAELAADCAVRILRDRLRPLKPQGASDLHLGDMEAAVISPFQPHKGKRNLVRRTVCAFPVSHA